MPETIKLTVKETIQYNKSVLTGGADGGDGDERHVELAVALDQADGVPLGGLEGDHWVGVRQLQHVANLVLPTGTTAACALIVHCHLYRGPEAWLS